MIILYVYPKDDKFPRIFQMRSRKQATQLADLLRKHGMTVDVLDPKEAKTEFTENAPVSQKLRPRRKRGE